MGSRGGERDDSTVGLYRVGSLLSLVPFLVLVLVLVHTRAPWIDEAWEAGPAVTLLREGRILDFGACRWGANIPYATKHEAHSLLQAAWYKVGGLEITWGRLLDGLCGAVFMLTIGQCLRLVGVSLRGSAVSLALIGTNYYLLLASSQIRPEAPALCLSAVGLVAFLHWQQRTDRLNWLFFSHAATVLASALHLQAGFLAAGLWAGLLVLERQALQLRHWLSLAAIYSAAIGAYLAYVARFWDEWTAQLARLFGGDMLGHRGGMIAATVRYGSEGDLLKVGVALALIVGVGVGLASCWGPDRRRRAFVIVAAAGYASWFLTTTHIDDYHAVWLMPAMALIGATIGGDLKQKIWSFSRAVRSGVGLPVLLLSLYGFLWAVRTGLENPRRNLFEHDLRAFDESFDLRAGGVLGPREIAWYFAFDASVLCERPERPFAFYLGESSKGTETIHAGGHTYTLAANGRFYTLFQLAP